MKLIIYIIIIQLIFIKCNIQTKNLNILNHKLTKQKFKKPKRIVLNNGLIIYLFKDRNSPLIKMRTYTKVVYMDNHVNSPRTKLLGLAIRSDIINITDEKLNKFLDYSNITINSLIKDNIAIMSLVGPYSSNVHKSNFIKASNIFVKLIRFPRLDYMPYKKSILESNKNPIYIANNKLKNIIFANKSPLMDNLNKITKKDLYKLHKTSFIPNNTIITITGNFEYNKMLKHIISLFGTWKKSNIKKAHIKYKAVYNTPKKPYHFFYKDIEQNIIAIGAKLVRLPHKDYYSLLLINEILANAPLSNRLFNRLRDDYGLVYYIKSKLLLNSFSDGLLTIYTEANKDHTIKIVYESIKVIKELIDKGLTKKELNFFKISFLNSLRVRLNYPHELLHFYALHELYGFSNNFLYELIYKINNLTSKDIQQVIKKYLNPNYLFIIIIGKKVKL